MIKMAGIALGLAMVVSSSALPATPAITIENAWARPTAGAATTGAAYLTIKNNGSVADSLVGATTDVATAVAFHESKLEGSVMTMRSLDSIPLQAGGTVEFAPGGKHLMLLGLKSALVAGKSFALTLRFKNAGLVPVQVMVSERPTPH